MTGFGRAEVTSKGIAATVEVRGVNSRFLEVSARLPRTLSRRDNDVKEIVRSYASRGKVSIVVTLESDTDGAVPLTINVEAARTYHKLLNQLRKAVRLQEKVRLSHLLQFSDIFETVEETRDDEREWKVAEQALHAAMKDFNRMRQDEGGELAKDLAKRIEWMGETVRSIESLSKDRIPEERKRLQERVAQLIGDASVLDQNRLELEIALLSDKLDVTEECVRYQSHNKFFLEAMANHESSGRRLNFLVQEMNREINTIGSKSNDATIAHLVVRLKEELERIREQLQNIE
jgi:uncharacterized protein (TIGR00255 family)